MTQSIIRRVNLVWFYLTFNSCSVSKDKTVCKCHTDIIEVSEQTFVTKLI